MKETSIIMSGEHPKLILEGKKTQTRRVIKPQPILKGNLWEWGSTKSKGISIPLCLGVDEGQIVKCMLKYCPYGGVGDRLWVRETWAYGAKNQQPDEIIYKADGTSLPDALTRGSYSASLGWGKWAPSIFMPRWASRILLEITEFRVEKLQGISNDDARAEGVTPMTCCLPGAAHYITPFKELWDSLNAERGYGWGKNPWVWVIGFKIALQSERK